MRKYILRIFSPSEHSSESKSFKQMSRYINMWPLWNRSYEKVGNGSSSKAASSSEEQQELLENNELDRRFDIKRNIIVYIAASFAIFAVILGLTLYCFSRIKSASGEEPRNVRKCGNTAAEATALGCEFDYLTWSWLSPTCPRYTSDDFMTAEDTPWNYYQDPDNRVLVSKQNFTLALDNQIPLYTERREHITHCVYTFLSLAQIIRDGTKTHPKLSSYKHMQHCAKITLESIRKDGDWWKVDASMGKVSFDEGC